MNKYGIDNVRGGPWCQVDLSDTQRKEIRTILLARFDRSNLNEILDPFFLGHGPYGDESRR